jgi:translation initiation factor IF-2
VEETPAAPSNSGRKKEEIVEEEPEVKAAPEKQEFKVLDKIDLSQIESRNRPVKKKAKSGGKKKKKKLLKKNRRVKETPKPVVKEGKK